MGLLQQLLGGGQQQQDYQDFVNRYQQGPPSEGYSDQEVLNRYQQVAPQLPPADYQQAAQEAFARMTPEQRMQFAQYVQQQAQQQGTMLPGFQQGAAANYQDPQTLARAMTQAHQQQPDLLQSLLGSGGALSNPLAKAALAGVAAIAAQRIMGGAMGGNQSRGGIF